MKTVLKLYAPIGLYLALSNNPLQASDTLTALQQSMLRSQKQQLTEQADALATLGKNFSSFSLDVDKKLSNLSVTLGSDVLVKAANPAALVIAGKWRLADTGDDWLRIYNASGTEMFGGIAMKYLWVDVDAHIRGNLELQNRLQLRSSTRWENTATLQLWDVPAGTMGNLMANKVVASYVNSPNIYGTLYGQVKSPSDRRLKEHIADLPSSLHKLKDLKPRTYTWKDKSYAAPEFGFIAQELAEVYPDLVTENPDGIKTVNYSLLVVPLVKAVQEQQAQIEALTKKLEALEKR